MENEIIYYFKKINHVIIFYMNLLFLRRSSKNFVANARKPFWLKKRQKTMTTSNKSNCEIF